MERLESIPVTRIRRSCRKPMRSFLPRRIDGYRRGRSVSHNPGTESEEMPPRQATSLLTACILAAVPAHATAADASKVFRYAFEVAETSFDPAEISDVYSSNVVSNIFDTPLTYDYLARPSKLIPSTLEAMPEVTENGTLYTMRVKPGIFFQEPPNGDNVLKGRKRELVAEDFVYSIKRIFDPKKRSPNLYLLEGNIAGMDEVLAKARKENRYDYDDVVEVLRALDRYTFQVRLKQPNYNFLYF